MEPSRGSITELLARLGEGDRSAEEELLPQVYVELHRLATARMRAERPGHTLQATALVHEAYVRLCGSHEITWHDRSHFFRMAGRLMRRILVDYARQRNAAKRIHGGVVVPLDEALGISVSNEDLATALAIDDVLREFAEVSPRQAQVVEMRFFAGMTEEEMALALGVTVRTIRRDWLMARAWLHQRLAGS
jgi:RNA polymerase sigma factor (TIGR02999 family)